MMNKSKCNPFPNYFCADILIQILINLPILSILRFKSVSKSWYSIIKSPEFIAKHLHHQRSKSKSYLLLHHKNNTSSLFYDNNHEFFQHSIIEYPVMRAKKLILHGSCNGLLCFSTDSKTIFIWNPATKQVVIIGKKLFSDRIMDVEGGTGLAFGFHAGINGYKLVRMVNYRRMNADDPLKAEGEIYSLRDKSWRRKGDIHETLYLNRPTVINGVVYWTRNYQDPHGRWNKIMVHSILSFDMGNDSFQEIRFPDNAIHHTDNYNYSECFNHFFTSAMEESLVLFGFNGSYLKLWVSDFSKPEIWVKSYKIIGICNPIKRPLGLRHNGDVLLVINLNGKMISYNLETQKWEKFGIYDYQESYLLGSHVESLVSILS